MASDRLPDTEKDSALDIAVRFLKWRWFIAKIALGGTLVAIVVALVIPKQYISIASVRGAAQETSLTKMLQSTGVGAGLGALADFAAPQGGGQIDYLVTLMKSHEILDAMIDRFNLRKKYTSAFVEDAREVLLSKTEIQKDVLADVISLGVYDENPDTAMAMTNEYVDLLNSAYNRFASQAAHNNRTNLQKSYSETMGELKILEDSLRDFQNTYGVYSITAQTEAAIKAAAALRSDILMTEINLKVKEGMLDPDAPEVRTLKSQLFQLNRSFAKLTEGDKDLSVKDIFIPFETTPTVGLRYLRLFRDVEIHSELIKLLTPMLEQAKLQEERETPSIIVIDHPTLPEKKSKPPRFVIVLIGFALSLGVGVTLAVSSEHLQKTRATDAERYAKLVSLYSALKSDVTFWRRKP
ncbi:MAG TPA: GNVR domain-containing protein [Bacteroidota bacterium]|nr:GNVR domain-containing protein [Bacteroidota bacterium]